jgi:hypothetical protein
MLALMFSLDSGGVHVHGWLLFSGISNPPLEHKKSNELDTFRQGERFRTVKSNNLQKAAFELQWGARDFDFSLENIELLGLAGTGDRERGLVLGRIAAGSFIGAI